MSHRIGQLQSGNKLGLYEKLHQLLIGQRYPLSWLANEKEMRDLSISQSSGAAKSLYSHDEVNPTQQATVPRPYKDHFRVSYTRAGSHLHNEGQMTFRAL